LKNVDKIVRCLPIIFLLSACAHFSSPPPPPIYLIIIDTLRVDALGCYGGPHPTPGLDALAKDAVLFENCFAPSSWTVPSTASIFTGLYPFHHGAIKALQDNGKVLSQQTLSNGYTTLAEICQQREYRTYGVSGNGHIAEKYGFAQGFDEFVTYPFLKKEAVASSWEGMRPRILAEQRFGQGTFAMLFFFDPHHPYAPVEPYISRYYPTWMDDSGDLLIRGMVDLMLDDYFNKNPKTVAVARAMYDSGVEGLDDYLSRMLKDLPNYQDALIIVTSDHGESFGEHGKMIHGNSLFQEQVHVPLLIKLPKNLGAGTRIAAPVSTVDLFPTLVEFIKAPKQAPSDGLSLWPLLSGGTRPPADLFIHIDLPRAHYRAMVHWPFKLIQQTDGQKFVFNLQDDPREDHNLLERDKSRDDQWFNVLQKQTRDVIRFAPRSISENIPDDLRAKMKNLGYLNN